MFITIRYIITISYNPIERIIQIYLIYIDIIMSTYYLLYDSKILNRYYTIKVITYISYKWYIRI